MIEIKKLNIIERPKYLASNKALGEDAFVHAYKYILRKEKKLPPFYRLISLIISGKNEQLIMKFAINIKSKLPKKNEVNILGPVLAPITKLKKKYRCRILIRYPKNLFIQKYLSQSLNKIKIAYGIKLEVDVDPINFS